MKHTIKILILSLLLVAACSPNEGYEDYTVAESSVNTMAADWWVIALEPDGETPAYGGDYVTLSTYNTAADDGVMWIDDHFNWMEIKTKVITNTSGLTFTGDDGIEVLYGGTVILTNGTITKETYITTSNTLVDEIYFEAEFDWAPGVNYVFKGHKKTGFLEDENPHY
ncbi:MAG: hypothetical protein GQ540_01595 [Lutibacter sp.]|uniref:lipid-binding protein n=1 Tax=Lutibacter sp. TaxID=1925666 RepID=UPI001A0D68C6|nr:lipid-binding protein [Lutibacter sp.]NOR27201.1 hypothetical protein [Lutibacter sp.]